MIGAWATTHRLSVTPYVTRLTTGFSRELLALRDSINTLFVGFRRIFSRAFTKAFPPSPPSPHLASNSPQYPTKNEHEPHLTIIIPIPGPDSCAWLSFPSLTHHISGNSLLSLSTTIISKGLRPCTRLEVPPVRSTSLHPRFILEIDLA